MTEPNTIEKVSKLPPAGFRNLLKKQYADDNAILFCARCGTAQTVLQVRLNRLNDGQYSLCCDDNLVAKRPTSGLKPKR